MPYKDPSSHADRLRERYRTDPVYRAKQKAAVRGTEKGRRGAVLDLVGAFRKDGCAACPERDSCCLTAHHVDPAGKDFDIASAMFGKVSIRRLVAELAKCVCLCQNCHAKLHAGRLVLPK